MDSLTSKIYIPQNTIILTRKFLAPSLNPANNINNNEESKIPYEKSSKVNPNVMCINFSEIEKSKNIATGDPIRCEKCLAYLNKFSVYDFKTKCWVCEFCNFPNILTISEDELIHDNIVTYIDPSQEDNSLIIDLASHNPVKNDGNTVIFCIDISGSMDNKEFTQIQSKYMGIPGSISRLEYVKIAVDEQLHKLCVQEPNTKVGIVCFGDYVILCGDQNTPDFDLGECQDMTFDEIISKINVVTSKFLTQPISANLNELLAKLAIIQPAGSTALGPALALSVGLLARQGIPGSKVILFSDGCANKGIGGFKMGKQNLDVFGAYEKIADFAVSKGVVISFVNIAEERCRLDALIPCAIKTGGNIVKVQPAKVSSDLTSFLEEKPMMFDCTIAVKLHNALKFYQQITEEVLFDSTVFVKKLGNVSPYTEFSYEYLVKSEAELINDQINLSKYKNLPIQALLNYVGQDKVRYCTVITNVQEITDRVYIDPKDINIQVMSTHSKIRTATLVLNGNLKEAKETTEKYRELIKGNGPAEKEYNEIVGDIERNVRAEEATMKINNGVVSDGLTVSLTKSFKRNPTK